MKEPGPAKIQETRESWDDSQLIVFLIGICLVLESGLIYYQAGDAQIIVTSIVGVSGLTLMLFSWLVPLEKEEVEEEIVELVDRPKELEKKPEPEAISLLKREEPVAAPPVELVPGLKEKEVVPEPVTPEKAESVPAEKAFIETVEEDIPWYQRLRAGLKKTRDGFVKKIKTLVLGTTKIDGDLLDELEGTLFEADIGVTNTKELLALLHKEVEEKEIKEPQVIYKLLRDELRRRLSQFSAKPNMNPGGMTVFLIIGVNGVGKTTTIAKLANKYRKEGKKVVLAAGDTFRAAAIDQLSIWGERAGVDVIRGKEGGDPGALVFDAIHAGKKRNADLLIVDTAGRMHVKTNLMDELKKIKKIAEKESNGGPHEIMLVIDSTTGQNAVQQAKLFNEALPITSLIMTKLDGTAKGGVIFSVQEHLNVPVKFIGVGEKMGDLMEFDPEQFLEALFADDDKAKDSDYNVL